MIQSIEPDRPNLCIVTRFPYLSHQDIVLHLLPRLHDSDNGCLYLMLPVVIHFLPRLFPFRV